MSLRPSDPWHLPPDCWDEEHWYYNVYQGYGKPELTLKAVLAGIFIGILLVAVNIYMGLKTCFGEGGSIIAAIFGLVLFRMFRARYSILENNITQTVGSAAGSIGNIVNVVPAFVILAASGVISQAMSWCQILLFIGSTSLLGIYFAIPLRRQVVIEEKLRFPSGTACAYMMDTFHNQETGSAGHGWMLGILVAVSGLVKLLQEGFHKLSALWLMGGSVATQSLTRLTVGVAWDPLLIGAGFLIGPRIGWSLLIGAIIAFPILGPWLIANGLVQDPGQGLLFRPIVAWTVWPGVMIMISAGLTQILIKFRIIMESLRSMRQIGVGGDLKTSFRSWLWGLLGSSLLCILVIWLGFGINPFMTLLAIILSMFMAAIAVRCIGQTEVNPISAFASMTQLIFGGISPNNVTANLTMAGVAGAGAGEAGDMMQDLKTGWLVGATPRKQVTAQFIGIIVGALAAVPMLMLVFNTYEMGGDIMPAPGAVRFATLAEFFSEGWSALPAKAGLAMLWASLAGVFLTTLEQTRFRRWVPSPVGIGVAMIIPFFYSSAIWLGSFIYLIMNWIHRRFTGEYQYTIGASGIAGSSLMGMIVALLIWLGILSS